MQDTVNTIRAKADADGRNTPRIRSVCHKGAGVWAEETTLAVAYISYTQNFQTGWRARITNGRFA